MVLLPLTAGGSLAAHALAYRLVAPHAHERANLLALTGHGYLGYAPLVVGLMVAVLLIGLGTVVADAARGSPRPRLSALSFLMLPLLGFVVQEHAERFVHDSHLALGTMLEPVFLVGLALQVPFALAVFLLGRALLAVAEVVGKALGSVSSPRLLVTALHRLSPGGADLARIPVLALGYPERGPPTHS